ncbi:rRNA adenine N-6-methyltransferase [Gordonia araii NBRC 100433]|uniref:rRNA adenine N-6-methyltransferase n=1 Tax=Gordonia araii NBRC 100433 TaxID=1073574 RepID=G7H0V5_9ACTN|nr:23S ribosomal RNA methyltransferase Erm [Gordonia araii]NNG97703.1 23S ribosomal RNA methyltransferase Erm [Gordonia araii NBRC 100433]GAB09480.1 rRNA adenine N-6-methyltransferase [Gordonia araii NBRC 100433]
MPRSAHGGRHELGQNFLNHRPTIDRIVSLVSGTDGPILEIGAGDGALTRPIAELRRPVVAIDLDEHRVRRLRRKLPDVRIEHADALAYPFDHPVVVGNIPFHLTTPILRRLLATGTWRHAILLTQWEVARKRAGVGGRTMLTAQAAPWFTFALHGRIPARHFTPSPGVDGGILKIVRRGEPLVLVRERVHYEKFVRAVFTGRGSGFPRILQHATGLSRGQVTGLLAASDIDPRSLPRDLTAEQWSTLWRSMRASGR